MFARLHCPSFSHSQSFLLIAWFLEYSICLSNFSEIVSIFLAKSSKSHSNPAKFYVLNGSGLTIPTPLVVKRFTTFSTFIFTLLSP